MGKKEKIAILLDKLFVVKFLFYITKAYYGKHIRVVNYHSTPPFEAANFEAQLKFFQANYSSVSYKELEEFYKTGKWTKTKPGLIFSFDDGFRDNVDVAVPLLEKYGFKGWFFIPVGMIDLSSEEQKEFVGKNENRYHVEYKDGRYLMSWDEIKGLYNNHVVGCHTWSHHRMNINDTDEILTKEITLSKQLMENKLQKQISIFCWAGGEEHTYTNAAAKKIKESGYKFSFITNTFPVKSGQSPLQINRTNIESRNSLALVRFQLSLLMDIFYIPKRKRVSKLLTLE